MRPGMVQLELEDPAPIGGDANGAISVALPTPGRLSVLRSVARKGISSALRIPSISSTIRGASWMKERRLL